MAYRLHINGIQIYQWQDLVQLIGMAVRERLANQDATMHVAIWKRAGARTKWMLIGYGYI
jgi:hypothetical protein